MHVVDGAHPDPEGQVSAVREVLGEVGADRLPELLVINKVDAADEETLLRLKRAWPDAVFVSARSGPGIDELHAAIARAAAAARRSSCGCCCRTTGVTWWPGSTGAVRC